MSTDERKVEPIGELLRLAQDVSDLHARGFKESYLSVKDKRLIYDSEWCRIKLVWGAGIMEAGIPSACIMAGCMHPMKALP
jgi:hypothetical protein